MTNWQIFSWSDQVQTRADFANFLRSKNLTGTAVEVGVSRGNFSQPFYAQWQGDLLILVDPWCPLDNYEKKFGYDRDKDFKLVTDRFKCYGKHVQIQREFSFVASAKVPDGLDFVYIDARHEYEYVKQDINLWWPKLQPKGILAGHDLFSLAHLGPTHAIMEFCIQQGLTVNAVTPTRNAAGKVISAASWFIEKGGE